MIIDVVVREAGPKGKGVFALRSFRKGEFIFRRRHGRVVSSRELATLSAEDQRHLTELDFDRYLPYAPDFIRREYRRLFGFGGTRKVGSA